MLTWLLAIRPPGTRLQPSPGPPDSPHRHRPRGGTSGVWHSVSGAVSGDALRYQLVDCAPIADDAAAEFQIGPQNVREGVAIAAGGKAGEAVERAHGRPGARIDAGFELGQIEIAQRVIGNLGGVVIASALRSAVTNVVFEAGDDAIRRGDIGALETAHGGGGVESTQPRIFTEAFRNAAPARIAREVDHRREGPIDADGRGFPRRNCLRFLKQVRFPRARQGQRNGKDGAETVDGIVSEDQRDAEPALFDGDALQPISRAGVFDQSRAVEK